MLLRPMALPMAVLIGLAGRGATARAARATG
jgi:hypothetical protein